MNALIKKICLLLVIVIFVFLLSELFTRIYLSIYFNEPFLLVYPLGVNGANIVNMQYHSKTDETYEYNTGGKKIVLLNTGVYRELQGIRFFKSTINSEGYRGALNHYNSNKKIIFCIGGSSTYGHVNDDKTYPALLQKCLNANQDKYLVYNLGARGLSSSFFLGRLQYFVSRNIKPDYVIIYAGYNNTGEHQIYSAAYTKFNSEFNKLKFASVGKYSLLFRDLLVGFALNNPRFTFGHNVFAEKLKEKLSFNVKEVINSTKINKSNIYEIIKYVKSIGGRTIFIEEYFNHGVDSLVYKSRVNEIKQIEDVYFLKELKDKIYLYDLIHLSFILHMLEIKSLACDFSSNDFLYLEPVIFSSYKPQEILIDAVHLSEKGNFLLANFISGIILDSKEK